MADTRSPIEQRRIVNTAIPGPRSLELNARRLASVAGGVSVQLPAFIERAQGSILLDADGNQLIDLGSGIAVTGVGHSHPKVAEAIAAQAYDFTHTCAMVTPYEEYVAVCEELNKLTPGSFEKHSMLVNSGAEALENAVKIARLATGRQAIVVFENAYHGRTNLTMALTAKNNPYKDHFGPFAPEIYRVAMSYPYRDGLSGDEAAARAISQIEILVGASNVAAVLIEPIQGEGGFIVPAEGFLKQITQWCAANGSLFIADEVQSGFCRTGKWFASEYEDIAPDIITTAKGIAAGMPLAGVTGRAELMDAVHPGGLGGTYGGNPVAAASALASINVMRDENLNAKALVIEEILTTRLAKLGTDLECVGDIRGRGAMIAVELVKPGEGKEPDAALAKAIVAECAVEGVVTLSTGTYGNVLRFLPALTIEEDLLNEGFDVVEAAARKLGA